MTDPLKPKIDEAVKAGMAALNVPGCAFALIRDRQISAIGVHGVADIRSPAPVTSSTRFSLQSISKSVAAWAMMKLVEDGRLDLDVPVSRYLKRWQLPPSDKFNLDLVTPRRLLSHRAGITTAGIRGVEPQVEGVTLIDGLNGKLPPPNAEQERHRIYWDLLEDEPVSVTHAPDDGWHYSNGGFAMLEIALEDITGRRYRDFVAEEIFRPLGMTDSGYEKSADAPYAAPHGRDGQPNINYNYLCGASAGVYATVGDLATFACAEMTGPDGEPPGRGIISPASIRTMFTSHGLADRVGEMQFETGLGHMILNGHGPTNIHHTGGTIGWRSVFSIFPETGDGICMLMNGEAANDLWIPIVREWREARWA